MRTPSARRALFALSVVTFLACKHDDASTGSAPGDAGGGAPIAAAAPPATGSTFGSGFEGDIAMHLTTSHGPEDATFVTKGGKLRVDAPARNGDVAHLVFDPAANRTMVILDAQKMYMDLDKAAFASAGARTALPETTIAKTGKHETIAGTDCEDWTASEANGKHVALCVAHGLGFFDFQSMAPGGAPTSAWAEELRMQQYFPLRAVSTDASGKETLRMEVTKIEKKPVDDALFAPPAGYRPFTMPRMPMGGIPGMPMGAPTGAHP
jgi:hypothetical protein